MFIQDNWLVEKAQRKHVDTLDVSAFACGSNVDQRYHHMCSIDEICAREDEIEADSFRTAQWAREDDLQRKWVLVSSNLKDKSIIVATTDNIEQPYVHGLLKLLTDLLT